VTQSDEFDRIVSEEQTIVPSSGFTASVMAAVLLESSAAAPLAFPWRRVLPGLIGSGVALAVLVQQIFVQPGMSAARFYPAWLPAFAHIMDAGKRFGVHWVTLTLFLVFASMRLSARLGRGEIVMR
jgi:hypothetical protein